MPRGRAGAAARVITALLPIAALCQSLTVARRPEDVGFSSQRLERVRRVMQADVESHRIPGAVLLIARQGKIASSIIVGFQDRQKQIPMKADGVFRIASMSKPITSVAAMILAEEGRIDIGAPVAQYLPEFSGVSVGVEKAAPKRAMTVQDLLRHTSGLTYGFFGDTPVDHMYRNANLYGKESLAEVVSALAHLPLLHQPGEVWEYSMSVDVLGRIVEVVSGMDLDAFISDRVTRPLTMNDTAFWLNASQAARMAHSDSPLLTPGPRPTVKPAILWGGGGMYSTARDYARFSQMLLNGGELDGVRILAPKTVALMTSDQLPPGTERHSPVAMLIGPFGPTPEMGTSFGLGFAVRTDLGRNPLPGSVGDFSWAGINGTLFWVDPAEKLVAVLMMQTPQRTNVPYWRQTRALVYQALTEPRASASGRTLPPSSAPRTRY